MTRRSVSAEERIFSLILALIASPHGLTRDELLSSVHGYAQEFKTGVPNPSLERKFERDKADLRDLGIPLETIDSPGEPGNTQLTRYRIRKSLFEIPDDITFSGEEIALIQAAALAWSEGSLTEDSRRAVMKLRSLAKRIDTSLLGIAPNLRLVEPSEQALRAAIRSERIVTFSYRKPRETVATQRTVSPLRLHLADGRWHLIAFDHDRDDFRVFLLSRIVGRISETGRPVDPVHADRVSSIIDDLEALRLHQVARVRVAPGSRAEARLRPRSEDPHGVDPQLRIHTLDYAAFAAELISYGQELEVLGPEELRERYHALAVAIAALHHPDEEEQPQ